MKFRPLAIAFAIVLAPATASAQPSSNASLQAMLDAAPSSAFSGSRSAHILALQVLLDRSGHSPGAIDGVMGGNTRRAADAFRRAAEVDTDGEANSALLRHLLAEYPDDILKTYVIEDGDVAGPFRAVPSSMTGQAELDQLGFESPAEALAEKFHMSKKLLEALNPDADFGRAGSRILVTAAGGEELATQVARIEVDKANSALRAYSADGKLVASYPATVGSSTFPSPQGSMTVKAVAHDPIYYFDPSGRDWGPDRKLEIAAGPNNPVGAVWIDLSRDGYGIHGTPEPRLIGKTASHGCVRLTNWDAAELAGAVSPGTSVEFIDN